MNINLIVTLMYLTFYNNFLIMFLFIPTVFLYFLNPSKSKIYFIPLKNIIYNSLSYIFKLLLFPNIYVNSNDIININDKQKNILMSNHISELDSIIGNIILSNTELNNINNIISKKNVGYQLPILSFIGLLTGDIYLHRNINLDIKKLNKKLNFNLMLMFPEGTCFTKNRKLISDNYCNKNKLIKFNYHLYPRISGIELIINNNSNINYIYDLTIIYDEIKKKNYGNHYSIFGYLFGNFKLPNKIFIQINKYKINNKKGFDVKMIENIYLSKDKFIDKFDITCNNFVPFKYDYKKEFLCFILVNLFCIFSIYLYINFKFIRYLYFFQTITYYIYFYLCV